MTEVATAYLSIVPETSKIGPGIKKALGSADGQAASAGKSMGGKLSSALAMSLKVGGAAAGTAAFAGIGGALTKGFSRLNTIDQAQAKLRALGSSGQEVESIMDNALAAVKGTAFGLGDAAGLAGTMVAAGIKPGQELESTLRLVADSAAIAGTDLNDMGQIWGKIAAKGKLDGETLDQLMERQIGILPELAKNYGVTTEEAAKMVSEGKVSFEDFAKVMTEKVGGGAEEMGETVQGAFENLKAAAGRIGATALDPLFKALPGGFSGITDAIDQLEPKVAALVETFSSNVIENWGPRVRDSLMGVWDALKGSGVVDQTKDTFLQLVDTGRELAPTIGRIVAQFAKVSSALGVSTWQVFLTVVQGAASVLSAFEPVLSMIADVMEAQPALVAAAVLAWAGFKTIPTMVGRAGTAIGGMKDKITALTRAGTISAANQQQLASAAANHAKAQVGAQQAAARVMIAEENLARVRATAGATAGQVASAESRLAAQRLMAAQAANRVTTATNQMRTAQAAAVAQSTTFGGTIRTAYAQGAAGATRFTRTAGLARGAMTGLSKAGSGLMGMMGGPWGLAMMGGMVAVMAITSEMQKSKQRARELAEAQAAVGSATRDTTVALRESAGALDDGVVTAMSSQIDAMSKLASKQWANPLVTAGVKGLDGALTKLGVTTDDLSRAMAGSDASWDQFVTNMTMANPAIIGFLPRLQQMRQDFLAQRDVAARVTPGVAEFGEAIDVLGDKSATAADKLDAIKTAMDALNPQRSKAEAVKEMGESIRKAADATASIGPDAFDAKGGLDAMSESGGKLTDTLSDLAEKQQGVAATGDKNAIARTNREIEGTLQSLADSTNQPIEKIRELYASFGGGENIDLMVKLTGAPETVQQIGAIQAAMNATPDAKYVEFQTGELTQGTLDTLETLGIKVTTMPDGKTIRVDTTGDAGAKLQGVLNTVNSIPPGKAIATTAPGGEGVRALLADMGVKVRTDNNKNIVVESPLAPGVKDLLHQIGLEVINRNGKNVIVKANDDDYVNKSHKWTETEYKQIVVQANDAGARAGSSVAGIFGRANGGINQYVNGGINEAEAFANGGMKVITKPMSADIFQGKGAGTVFAEEETGGEAYIPLAKSKRNRSTSILATVADMFGMSLVPKEGTVSGILGGIAGGAVSKLLKAAGADGLTRFADGGFNAKQLKDLANGAGASQPLKGAPYVWGGVNWGDCSGAMSALTRAAAGLSPFGGRWSTGSAASDLPAMGFQQGMWKSGTMGVGFYNGGPGGGHTAGTLPDGTNVEMGGSYGGGMVGGSVGANHSQFTDHWFMPVTPERPKQHTDLLPEVLGIDDSQTVPDGGTTTSPGATESRESTISGMFGKAAQEAVSGQVQDILGVFGINDSPGVLAGWAAIKKPGTDGTGAGVTDPGTNKPAEGEDTGKSKAGGSDESADTTETTPAAPALTGIDLVKDQFKKGLREAWRTGGEWAATDWIVNKESTWNPAAQNGKYHGLIQAGAEVYRAAGVDPNTVDPTLQAKAFDKYVGGRYELPTKAKAFHEANNWYDQGGVAQGVGHMLKNTLRPERVLSPTQTAAFEDGMRRGFSGDTSALEAKLDQLVKVIIAQGPNGVQPARNDRDFADKQRQKNRRLVAAGKGGRP
ncbi:tape measure protein [Gordonia sp. (in: high G+C Gram-positive bacteria)]|uniref:aggregation-promoting factor C-terminal-like domain-containing protein n=1 Tax=Gordonia sp. (in: high G+C Gram-positive bacteria) TaxID=84139 RepID=UPI003F951E48